ncbi:hypothetical protein CEUSTIGMA_g5405.t1 [Chlamydomonas eustigma]|uniref:Peptidase M50 domain-containing protein n=1 Tax=Chlamydomonas eustigma TaxID=1157962 RepID=A0A250X4G0_9CHLO|nr:hypothetical protein CEUSTIGMA_g5405.t1 [Chlamydomonas eustigma]|eukprot:GAX77963.1 hypothetical protein CEUSTIGMA_g5405.t1 [Chlamydomonas eustigma]
MVEDEEEGTASARSSSSAGAAPSLSSNSKARGFIEGKRVAFQIIPTAMAQPPQTNAVRRVAAVVLGLLLVVTSLQLSLASNITKLPTETLQWFANPDNLNSDQLPPGLENWDPSSYIETAIPVLAGVILVQVAHETGHRLAAGMRGVKLGPSYFIPFSQVGSFGAITPFTSIVKDYKDMWDVAAAGPLAGAMASVAMLAIGLVQSKTGADVATSATDASVAFQAASALIPVPTSLFQGSLLLGSVTRFVLGQSALQGSSVLLSPLVIAGWVGCITTALNLLPLGSLDGGRMVQAAYGRKSLSLASFFSYLGLGLGLLGSTLALPFGLYVIITQRTAEKYIRDSVSTAGQEREAATLVALLTAILVLLPLAPELAASLGVGSTNPFI